MIPRLTIMNRRSALGALIAAFGLAAPTASAMPGVSLSLRSTQVDDNTPYAIDPLHLRELIEADPEAVRVIDVSPLRTYRDAHIPGAIHEFWEDTVDREYTHFGAVVTQGEDQRQRIDFVRKLAIDPALHVVAYDDHSGFRAARIVWYLRFLGFDRVSMLDGGLREWTDAGYGSQSGVNTVEAAPSASVTPREGFYVVTRQLLERIESRAPLIVDTRTDEERNDDLDGQIPLGTIPGSIRFPWTAMINSASGRLLDRDQLRRSLDKAGLTAGREIVLFARFGVDAALPWLALKHLGYPNVETYDRGWVEWASRPDLERDPL